MRLAPLATLFAASAMALALSFAPSARASGVATPSAQEGGACGVVGAPDVFGG